MLNNDLSVCLDEMLSASEDDRVAIREHILTENQTLNDEAVKFTANVPKGYTNWQEAYNGARSAYVKNLMNRSSSVEPEPDNSPANNTVEDTSSSITISSLFN